MFPLKDIRSSNSVKNHMLIPNSKLDHMVIFGWECRSVSKEAVTIDNRTIAMETIPNVQAAAEVFGFSSTFQTRDRKEEAIPLLSARLPSMRSGKIPSFLSMLLMNVRGIRNMRHSASNKSIGIPMGQLSVPLD